MEARKVPLMQFFLSQRDKSYLLVMDSASRYGNLFKVAAEDTWTLIWSGVVTEGFLESPDWEWATAKMDPARFQGGWPKPS
jgi:hypothetical protein